MSKMNQRFTDEYGSGFTKSIEDFCDDDYTKNGYWKSNLKVELL
jgi:hypothetical protein